MREAASQRNKTLCKARIPQIRLAEFGTRPVVSIVSVDQFQLPSRTEWAKVNIDTDCLQAIIHSCAQKVVGNPEAWAGVRLEQQASIPGRRVFPDGLIIINQSGGVVFKWVG